MSQNVNTKKAILTKYQIAVPGMLINTAFKSKIISGALTCSKDMSDN